MTTDPQGVLAAYYSRSAEHYARQWAPMLRPLGESLLASLSLEDAQRVLDVGAGTGTLAPALEQCAPQARVLGVDLALGMLRASRASRPDRDLALMDAQRLGIGTATVDAVLFAFVLFHVPSPVAALREAKRVLRPGGEVGVTTWGRDEIPGAEIWGEELDRLGASADELPGEVCLHALMDGSRKLESLLREAQLSVRDVWMKSFERQWTVDDLMATRRHCGGPARRLSSLSPERRASCLQRVEARLAGLPAGELREEMEVIFAIGQVS